MAPWETRGTQFMTVGGTCAPGPSQPLPGFCSPPGPQLILPWWFFTASSLRSKASEGRSCARPQRTGGHEGTVDTLACQTGLPGERRTWHLLALPPRVLAPGTLAWAPAARQPGMAVPSQAAGPGVTAGSVEACLSG